MIKFRIVSARVFAVGSWSKSHVLLEQQQHTANCGVKLRDALCCLCSILVFERELVFHTFDIDVLHNIQRRHLLVENAYY